MKTKSTTRAAGLQPPPTSRGVDKTPPKSDRAAPWRRILIVDDHPMTRAGLAATIECEPGLVVCGKAQNAAEAMTALAQLKPDLLVTDLTMPGRSGTEFIRDVHAMMPELPILVLSMHDETLYAERALKAGARGYLMKDAGSEVVIEVIRRILRGDLYVSPALTARFVDSLNGQRPRGSSSPIETLTNREFEVFCQFGRGKSTKEVAKAMNLSSKTVDVHRQQIKEKLRLKDVPSLIHYAACWLETQSVR